MPIYEYKCEKGHVFEELQKMADDPLTTCVECGAPVERVFHPIAVHFKGSGFYTTDYGSKKAGAASSSSDNNSSDSGSSDSSSSSDSGSSEKKSEKKSESKTKSSSSGD